MVFKPKFVLTPLILIFALVGSTSLADQTDQRLDSLFTMLKGEDQDARGDAERKIWEIWFESGDEDINTLMDKAGEAEQFGLLRTAEALYGKVINRLPKYAEGWNRRATIRYYKQDYNGSLADIQQTIKLEPRHFGALWGLGMILGVQQQHDDAIVVFERLLEIKPNAKNVKEQIESLRAERTKEAV